MEDVVGWRLQDVVDKIRGPKDSVVRLQLLPKSAGTDGVTRTVSLVRNEIKLEDQAAKAYVLEDLTNARGLRIGVLEVPGFYRDFRAESDGDKDFRSTTRDVQGLLADLKRKGVDGIVVDLRGNVDTRIGRVGADLDAVVLARAGLLRLGRAEEASEVLDPRRPRSARRGGR